MKDFGTIHLHIPEHWPRWMKERYLSIVAGFHREVCDGVEAATRTGEFMQAFRDGQEWTGEPRLLTAEQTSQAGRMIVQAMATEEED